MDNQNKWNEVDGKLVRTVELDDFMTCIELTNQIATVAENAQHHPNLYIHDYKKIKIELYTHDRDSITNKDWSMAKTIDELL